MSLWAERGSYLSKHCSYLHYDLISVYVTVLLLGPHVTCQIFENKLCCLVAKSNLRNGSGALLILRVKTHTMMSHGRLVMISMILQQTDFLIFLSGKKYISLDSGKTGNTELVKSAFL